MITDGRFEVITEGMIVRARHDAVETHLELDGYGSVVRESQYSREILSDYDRRCLRVRRGTPGGWECEWRWDPNGQVESMRLPGNPWGSWLLAAVRNRAIDCFRSHGRPRFSTAL